MAMAGETHELPMPKPRSTPRPHHVLPFVFCLSTFIPIPTLILSSRRGKRDPRRSLTRRDLRSVGVDCLSYARLGCILAIQIVRLGVGGLLLVYGIFFLVYTVNVADLMLNAVALEFVLNIDEVLFASLAPARFRQLYNSFQAIRLPSVRTWRGLDLRACLNVAAVAGLLGAAIGTVLVPQMDVLVHARDALCAGDRDFVFTRDGIGAIAWAYPDGVDTSARRARNYPDGKTPKPPESQGNRAVMDEKETYAASTIDNLLRQSGRDEYQDACGDDLCYQVDAIHDTLRDKPGRPDCCFAKKTKLPSVDAGRFSIFAKSTESTVQANEIWNPGCFDVLNVPAGYQNLLEGAMGDAVGTANRSACGSANGCTADAPMCHEGACVKPTCTLVKSYCHKNNVAGVRARQLCPQTCGCDQPRSPLALSLPSSGCGDRCPRSGTYLDALDALRCEDVDVSNPAFTAFLDDWDQARLAWPNDWHLASGLYITALRAHGCGFLGSPAQQVTLLRASSFLSPACLHLSCTPLCAAHLSSEFGCGAGAGPHH